MRPWLLAGGGRAGAMFVWIWQDEKLDSHLLFSLWFPRRLSSLPLKQCPFDFTEKPPSRSALPQRLVVCSQRVPGVFSACSWHVLACSRVTVGCGAPVLGPERGDGAPAQADRSGTARSLLEAHVTLTGDLGRSSPRSASLGPGLGRERRGRRCGLRSGLRGSQRDLLCHVSVCVSVCVRPPL